MIVETTSLDRGASRKRVLLDDSEKSTRQRIPRAFRATIRDTARGWIAACRRYVYGRNEHTPQEEEVEYR